MIDFDYAFTRVNYRLDLDTQPKDRKLAFLAGLEAVCTAKTPQLCELRAWLKSTIEEDESIPMRSNREVVEVKKIKGGTYQHEKIRCGKSTCKCAKGTLHEPYWYTPIQRIMASFRASMWARNYLKWSDLPWEGSEQK